MGSLKQTCASFVVSGKSRDQQFAPNEITELLGVEPTRAHAIGDIDEKHFRRTGRQRAKEFAVWRLSSDRLAPGDLNLQIKDMLARLPDDPDVWRQLSAKFRLTMFCGLWMEGFNSGAPFDSETLRLLGERNVDLDLDIYQDPDYIHDEDEESLEFWKQVDANIKGAKKTS